MSWEEVLKRTPDYEFGDAPRTDTYEKDTQTRLKVINEFLPVLKKYESFIKAHSDRVEKLEDDRVELNKMVKELDKFPVLMADKNSRYNEYINEVIKSLDESIAGRIAFMDAHSIEPPQPAEAFDLLTSALYEDKDELTERLQ